MDFQKLERRLSQRPSSPLFARVAEGYVLGGKFREAEELCRAGLAKYPHYSTARIVLGKCLAETGRRDESLEVLRSVLRSYPDSGIVRKLIADVSEKSVQPVKKLVEPQIIAPSAPAAMPKLIEEVKVEARAIAAPSELKKEVAPQSVPIEHVKEVRPVEAAKEISEEVIDDGRIVSRTLAEIYAGQGAFEEAIHTYQLLRRKRPGEAASIEERIAELRSQNPNPPSAD